MRQDPRAIGVGLAAALLTGLWWLPIRALELAGLGGGIAASALLLGGLPALVLWRLLRGGAWPTRRALLGAAACGAALVLYSTALTDTTVVRAVLLFYLAPVWALGLEWLGFARRLKPLDALPVVLAALGLVAVFRGELSLDGWRMGDTLALGAGMGWSLGSALLAAAPRGHTVSLAMATCTAGGVLGLALTFVVPSPSTPVDGALATVFALGTLYLAPSVVATLWSASRLRPTTMSYLLTAEIVSGIASAALLLDEPFGWPEGLGSLLIASAALVEIVASEPVTTQT